MTTENAFELATSNIRFGPGVTREIGMDLGDLKVRRAMVLADPIVAKLQPVATVVRSLEENGIEYALFDRVRVEPSRQSFNDAIKFASEGGFDGFVAVGGGSTIDTAKAANLYSTYPPEDFFDYVNPPLGKGQPVPGPLKPLIAVPTTAGTGSETTGIAIFDMVEKRIKTGVAHRRLKPTMGLLDPENTRSMPASVAASTGLDVLSHAIESYTAIPYYKRPMPERPIMRPAYQGSNLISDVWALESLRMVTRYLERAVRDPGDDEARGQMLLAASYAGIGFGNAGVHLPHGMSYPVSGMVRQFKPDGYDVDHPLIPHGYSVILSSPAVFRFTSPACPERHLTCAEILGVDISRAKLEDAGKILAGAVTSFMMRLGLPNGLRAVGYGSDDIPNLVKGTMPQHRVTKLSPRPASEEDLAKIFEEAMVAW